jgi:hypothetical protein
MKTSIAHTVGEMVEILKNLDPNLEIVIWDEAMPNEERTSIQVEEMSNKVKLS